MSITALEFQAETQLPTQFGRFRFRVYKNSAGEDVIAIATPRLDISTAVPVRIHSACFTAEVVGSLKCDCKQQLDYALEYITRHGGVVVYLPQEGRGIGLANKIRAYALQEDGHDTISANRLLGLPIDGRRYHDAAGVLQDLGVQQLRLITNNPEKLAALTEFGFTISERIPVPAVSNRHSHAYLETKRQHMGHWLKAMPEVADNLLPEQHLRRPYVHINFAINADGLMNQDNGEPLELSCALDWQRVHELRERYTAVVVGARTWVQDNPQLSAREERLGRPPSRQPDRVIFAGATRCTVTADARRSFVIGIAEHSDHAGIHITTQDRALDAPLSTLYRAGVESMLVEGGLTLLRSFIEQDMFDHVTVYVSTTSVTQARQALAKLPLHIPQRSVTALPLGEGVLLSYRPTAMATSDCQADSFTPLRSVGVT